MIQEIGFSGIFNHLMDVVSNISSLNKKFLVKTVFFQLLFETQPACVFKMFLNCLLNFTIMPFKRRLSSKKDV